MLATLALNDHRDGLARCRVSPSYHSAPSRKSSPVITLMGEILDEVYQSPARLAAIEDAYQARSETVEAPEDA
ncbi:hypothetical protein [Mycobacterium conspicuum]|nr:hypothetical protein [Mycobacterium conspicuum]ORV41717.1 hypothetical protein AWC00_13000 [Mycobacterium conspicuum]CNH00621.1 Uncharacterised protein [Mycobacterium tuberculosis]